MPLVARLSALTRRAWTAVTGPQDEPYWLIGTSEGGTAWQPQALPREQLDALVARCEAAGMRRPRLLQP